MWPYIAWAFVGIVVAMRLGLALLLLWLIGLVVRSLTRATRVE